MQPNGVDRPPVPFGWLVRWWASRRMTRNCNMLLTSMEPIVEVLIRCECHADGWSLWLRHRHYAGLFSDCQPEEFSRLSASELGAVLEASAASWGPEWAASASALQQPL